MSSALHSLEALRDHGLFLFRTMAGGTLFFYGAAELGEGRVAWIELGDALGVMAAAPLPETAGFLVAAAFAGAGAALVLGLWTRVAALLLGSMMAVVALLRWPEVRSGTLEGAAAFFYPATMVAALWSLATTGGGRFGVDAVYRARQKRKRRRGDG